MKRTTAVKATVAMGAAVISAMLMGAVAVEGATYKHEETISKTITLDGARLLSIGSLNGDIFITGEKGRETVALKIVKTVTAEDEESARKIAESMGVVVTRPEGTIKIETRYPRKGKVKKSIFAIMFERGQSMRVSMTLTVPAGMLVEASSASGDIEVIHILNDVEVSTASGDLVVRDIGGDVEANVASGDIEIEDVTGSVKLSSAAGDMVVRNVGGDAEISVATGDTEITSIGGALNLTTYSGDSVVDGVGAVSYEGISGSAKFVDVRGAVAASAASGDLDFRVMPQGLNDYSITTSSGNVTLSLIHI